MKRLIYLGLLLSMLQGVALNAAEVKMVVSPFKVDFYPGEPLDLHFQPTDDDAGHELMVECFYKPMSDQDEGYEIDQSRPLQVEKGKKGEDHYIISLKKRLVLKSFLSGRRFDFCNASIWLKRKEFDDVRYDTIIIDDIKTTKRKRNLTKRIKAAFREYRPN